jgi:hypothetical protein
VHAVVGRVCSSVGGQPGTTPALVAAEEARSGRRRRFVMVLIYFEINPSSRRSRRPKPWRDGCGVRRVVDMRRLSLSLLVSMSVLGLVACQDDESDDGAASGSTAPRRLVEQVKPSIDVTKPPEDATKTASGLVYKKLTTNEAGARPTRRDTALVQYTGWRQRTGDTFFTTKGHDQPIAMDLATAAPGFAEALALLHKGEKAMLWIPASPGTAEPLVYEVEVVDVIAPAKIAGRSMPSEKGDKDEAIRSCGAGRRAAGRICDRRLMVCDPGRPDGS